jgi:predicted ATPase with chaperone activity
MSATSTLDNPALDKTTSLISALGLDDSFQPQEPATTKDTGLSEALIEDLILKFLSGIGSESGRAISDNICLPMAILEDRLITLRQRQEIAPSGSAMLGDHIYRLTDVGRDRAHRALRECAYVGPAPVPLDDYVSSVGAQTIASERPRRPQLEKAFADIHVEPEMLSQLGPAINAGKGMFIYGPPGNGKTTIAQRITRCFGQTILIPHAIVEGGRIIKMFDASCHKAVRKATESLFRTAEFDRRWIRIERPTVVVGGELTMDSLELKHDPVANVSEASLQMKSNCGCLLIDDFGRQRINPTELLNRWIIPLENRIDYLSLANGRKIEVPFEQLIIFSTNLEPHELADDAFLRRIPFKVEVGDPLLEEFHLLFQIFAKKLQVDCPRSMVDYLIRTHYHGSKRPLRRCHARDLLEQVMYHCSYNELPLVITEAYLDQAVRNYFTALKGD